MKLAKWLKINNVTVPEFASRVDMSASQVYRLVNGEHWPQRETAIRIMLETNYEVSPEDFLEGVESVKLDRRESKSA